MYNDTNRLSNDESNERHQGFCIEYMFANVIKTFKWSHIKLKSKDDLAGIMQKHNPKRLADSLYGMNKNEGLDYVDLSARNVMDYVYGVDFLVMIDTIDGPRVIAIDVTANSEKVDHKVNTHAKLKPAIREGLRAHHCLVVCWVDPRPFAAMSPEDQLQLVWARISDRIDALVQEKRWCGSVFI